MKNSYILITCSLLDIYTIAIKSHLSLAKSKSKELESGFHAMKLASLRLIQEFENLNQNLAVTLTYKLPLIKCSIFCFKFSFFNFDKLSQNSASQENIKS